MQPSPSPPVTLYKAGPGVVKVCDTRNKSVTPSDHQLDVHHLGDCQLQILTAVFKALKINDVDVESCANDVGNAGVYLKDFAEGKC